MEFVKESKLRKICYVYVSSSTLRRMADTNRIPCKVSHGGTRFYNIQYFPLRFNNSEYTSSVNILSRLTIVYGRVSSRKQIGDLTRQIATLKQLYPDARVITDIASGINFKRPGLIKVLDLIISKQLKQLVVLHKDRLARFSVELIQYIAGACGCKVIIVNNHNNIKTNELHDDLLAIMNVFVARHNGQRSAFNKRQKQKQ